MELEHIYDDLERGDYKSAETAILQLRKLSGHEVEAQGLLVAMYVEQQDSDRAEQALRVLLEYASEDSYTLFLQARIDFMQGKRLAVIRELAALLRCKKDIPAIYLEKIYNLLGQCYRFVGESREAAQAYRKAADAADNLYLKALEWSSYLFNLHYLDISATAVYEEHLKFGRLFSGMPSYKHRRRTADRCLRIGYISPDIREHVVLRFSYALFAAYNHMDFAVYCYANGTEDSFSGLVAEKIDGWRNIRGMTAEKAARQIYTDQIDILVDLAGHTKNNSLPVLAYKPAPIQLSGIGYFASTGLSTVDYFIGDEYLDSQGEEQFFCEKLLRLPHSHFCYVPFREESVSVGAPCQKNGFITFGSFNNFTKVTDEVLKVWAAILQQVPDSHLLLKAEVFDYPEERAAILQRLMNNGIPAERLILQGFTHAYMEAYTQVDIALDTYPYPGGGTTCDALYMGVPVVSLRGEHHGQRFGYSILMNVGLEEFVAASWTEYIQKAVQLAGDTELLGLLHKNIRAMLEKSFLMDMTAYMKDLEISYQTIWEQYCKQQPMPVYRELALLLPQLQHFAEQGDWQQAMAVADALLAAKPSERYMLEKIVETYLDGGDFSTAQQAVNYLKRLPQAGYTCFLEASVLFAQGKWSEAEKLCQQALKDQTLAQDRQGMTHSLLARLYKKQGRLQQSAMEYLYSAQCKDLDNGKAAEYSNYLLGLHYFSASKEERMTAAMGYGDLMAGVPRYEHMRRHHDRLRIGYISGDFCRHVAAFFSTVFFEHRDVISFVVYGYSLCPQNPVADSMAAKADVWRNVNGKTAAEIARQIFTDEIDILVDLSGHTGTSCLPVLAHRPAPIQISGIGYFDTTGMDCVNYFLVDGYTVPGTVAIENGKRAGFTEQLLRMSKSHLCYMPQPNAPQPGPAPCRQNGSVTFGCFNNFMKITDEVLHAWRQILQQVPGAKLLLKSSAFDDEAGKSAAQHRLLAAGIASDCLLLEGYTVDYLSAYHQVDIALDTWPYPGGGTTCDALYMGVPVITLAGQSHHERFGCSILENLQLGEWVAESIEAYIQKAVTLAENPDAIITLHQTLRRRLQQSPVMDGAAYMFDLEALYMQIWNTWYWKNAFVEQEKNIMQEIVLLDQAVLDNQWDDVLRLSASLNGKGVQSRKILPPRLLAFYRKEWYDQVILLAPKALAASNDGMLFSADIWFILAQSLRHQGQAIAAHESFYNGLECLRKEGKSVDNVLEFKFLAAIALVNFELGRPSASDDYHRAYTFARTLQDKCNMYSSWLLSFNYRTVEDKILFSYHKGYNNLFDGVQPYLTHRHSGSKIRIGYVSGDFRDHVMYSFLFCLVSSYDEKAFEVICYNMAEESEADGYTTIIQSITDGWCDLSGLSYAEAAAQIHADEIDILFDLAGHSSGGGLPIFAWKPAPIQISGLGYMNTTGLATMDYFLVDEYTVPQGSLQEKCFTEKLVRLPSQFCYFGKQLPLSSGTPGRYRGWLLFGVFNHYRKITDEMLAAWRDILEQVPDSKILFKSQLLVNLSVQDEAYERIKSRGFDMDRVIFEPATRDYMYRYLDVDIALDTYPYPGGGTTCDALYMGVPVISRYGMRHGSRFGYSILQNVGLSELAVSSLKDYVERAVGLAKDWDLLDLLHRELRSMMKNSPIMDSAAYMKGLENLYQRMWHQYNG